MLLDTLVNPAMLLMPISGAIPVWAFTAMAFAIGFIFAKIAV
jgi:hypothetical protein